jgi:AcrR family transcriptional regulator
VTTATGGRPARREELLAATRRVVGRVGFAATTVGEITKEAGASLGLLHYHFASKAEVVAETFAQIAREDLAELEAAARGGASSPERLAAVLDLSDWTDRESWRLWIDAWGEAVHSEPMRETLAGFQQGWRAMLGRVLADGVEDGSWSCDDPADLAARLVAMIDGIGLHATLHPHAVPPERAHAWARRVASLELRVELAPAPRSEPAPELPALTVRLPLRRRDLDADGRLDPVACAALLAEGRHAWLAERLPSAETALVRLEVEHHEAVEGGDGEVTVRCSLDHAGHRTLRTRELLLAGDGTPLATAEATVLLPHPLTADDREALVR